MTIFNLHKIIRKLVSHIKWWWIGPHPRLGALVGWRGSGIRYGGCIFKSDHSRITDAIRGELWLGRYECHEIAMAKKYLPRDCSIIELGGCLGVTACIVNRWLKNPDRHVVVEADPELAKIIELNKIQNDCQFSVVNRALSYHCGLVSFRRDVRNPVCGSISEGDMDNVFKVDPVKLCDLSSSLPGPCALICDIEGAEKEMLSRDSLFITNNIYIIIIEVHDLDSPQNGCSDTIRKIESMGFNVVESKKNVFVMRKKAA